MGRDPNVKSKEAFAEARLEMIPFWTKRLGEDVFRAFGPVFDGGNGL